MARSWIQVVTKVEKTVKSVEYKRHDDGKLIPQSTPDIPETVTEDIHDFINVMLSLSAEEITLLARQFSRLVRNAEIAGDILNPLAKTLERELQKALAQADAKRTELGDREPRAKTLERELQKTLAQADAKAPDDDKALRSFLNGDGPNAIDIQSAHHQGPKV